MNFKELSIYNQIFSNNSSLYFLSIKFCNKKTSHLRKYSVYKKNTFFPVIKLMNLKNLKI